MNEILNEYAQYAHDGEFDDDIEAIISEYVYDYMFDYE